MKAARDLVAFAVQLGRQDLGQLREGDWLNLKDDLASVLGKDAQRVWGTRAGVLVMSLDPPLPQDYPEAAFRDLQETAKQIFSDVSQGRLRPVQPQKLQVRLVPLPNKDRSLLGVAGSVRDVFLLILLLALTQTPNAPIRRCPECKTIFLRVRRQRYCTGTCANRANMRTWRRSQRGKQRVSEANRRAYERRVKAKTVPSVKVRRNAGRLR